MAEAILLQTAKQKAASEKAYNTAATFAYVSSHPLKAIVEAATGNLKSSIETFKKKSKKEQIKEGLTAAVGKAAVAAAIVAAPSVIAAVSSTTGKAAVATAAKSLVPATLKGKIIAAVAAPVAIGAVIKQPAAVGKAIVSAPSALANFGGNVASLAANPTLEGAKEVFKDNPLITAAVGLAVGGGIIGTASTIMNTAATKANTEAMGTPIQTQAVPAVSTLQNPILEEKQVGVATTSIPVSPQTTTISTGKRRRRAKVKTSPCIHNSVRVNVINNSIGAVNRKYLKRVIYA